MATPEPGDGRVQSDVLAEEAAAAAQASAEAAADDERTVAELQDELRDLGQPTSGTKAELLARLNAAEVAEPEGEPEDAA